MSLGSLMRKVWLHRRTTHKKQTLFAKPLIEELERRDVPSTTTSSLAVISGSLYTDTNGNGQHDTAETTALSGWTVYLDADNNAQLDTGEQSVLTDSTG